MKAHIAIALLLLLASFGACIDSADAKTTYIYGDELSFWHKHTVVVATVLGERVHEEGHIVTLEILEKLPGSGFKKGEEVDVDMPLDKFRVNVLRLSGIPDHRNVHVGDFAILLLRRTAAGWEIPNQTRVLFHFMPPPKFSVRRLETPEDTLAREAMDLCRAISTFDADERDAEIKRLAEKYPEGRVKDMLTTVLEARIRRTGYELGVLRNTVNELKGR